MCDKGKLPMTIVFISGESYHNCAHIPTPSAADPICSKFFKRMDVRRKHKTSYLIKYWNEATVSYLSIVITTSVAYIYIYININRITGFLLNGY